MLVISDAQRVVPMVTPHPVLRVISDFHSKTTDPPTVLALLTVSADRWSSLDPAWLEATLRAQTYYLATKTAKPWLGPMELVMEYEAAPSVQPESSMSGIVRRADPEGLLVRPYHYRRARRIFQQLGSFAANAWWRDILDGLLASSVSDEAKVAVVRDSLELIKDHGATDALQDALTSSKPNVTSKVSKLLQVLQPYASYGDRFRGIIFGWCRILIVT